jgi:hypothetical protein
MRHLATASLIVAATVVAAPRPGAQTVEGVLARVNQDEIITRLDVRQARLLKLVQVEADTERAWVDALINRRLMLAEVARYSPPEPAGDALAARRRQWEATLDPGANLADSIGRAGMTDAAVQSWLRDDLRLRAYLDRRFPAVSIAARDDLLKYYREHEAEFTGNGVLRPFDEVEADVRSRLSATARATAIAAFIAELRRRADIR